MALARARRDVGLNYWPGFVDALSTLILGIIFLLSVFVVVQFYLTQEVSGKDTALSRLNAQIAQLSELLSLEKTGKLDLEAQLAQLRSSLSASEGERDRYKGLYEGLGSGAASAQGKINEMSSQLDAEKRLSARALAQVEVLNQQIAALRRDALGDEILHDRDRPRCGKLPVVAELRAIDPAHVGMSVDAQHPGDLAGNLFLKFQQRGGETVELGAPLRLVERGLGGVEEYFRLEHKAVADDANVGTIAEDRAQAAEEIGAVT